MHTDDPQIGLMNGQAQWRYCVVNLFTVLVTPSLLPVESIDSTV
jgi:hypothetical protein